MMLAELTGNIHIGLAFGGAAIGIGIAAAGGVMAIGRNPGTFGKVFTTMLDRHGAGRRVGDSRLDRHQVTTVYDRNPWHPVDRS